jgi:hypothetical protein
MLTMEFSLFEIALVARNFDLSFAVASRMAGQPGSRIRDTAVALSIKTEEADRLARSCEADR